MYYPPASLISTGIILPLLGIISTATRFWIRVKYRPSPIGIDDWIIVGSTTLVTGLGILQVFDTIYGHSGNDATSVGKIAIVKWKADYAQVIIEKVAFGSIKLSILFFYRRIFAKWSDFLKYNNFLVGLVILWTLTYLIGEFAACGAHPDTLWYNREAADQKCMDHGAFLVSFAATDVFTDLIVIGMPIPFIHRLHISSRQKWGLVAVFFMGFVSTLAGILRLGFLSFDYQIGQFTWNPPPLANPPKILQYINPIFWTNVELCFGVVAANLMTFAPLIRAAPPRAKKAIGRAYRILSHTAESFKEGVKEKVRVTATSVSTTSVSEASSGILPHLV